MRSCIKGNDVIGHHPMSEEDGVRLTLFTNAMQRGHTALHQPTVPTNELQAIYRDIERCAVNAGRSDIPDVVGLLTQLEEKISPAPLMPSGGWGDTP